MSEEKKDEPEKIWRVVRNVPAPKLEDRLNELASDGYQIFRIDRFTRPHPRVEDTELPWYDVVAFNPTLLGAKSMEGMAELARKAAAQALETAGGQPVPGAVG